ncbi:MAG: ABC transporter substrate-binding protein [Candidatus Methylomirabilia bacterium]
MKRRAFALTLALGLLAAPLPAEAQKAGKVYRIAIWGVSVFSELISAGSYYLKGELTEATFEGICSEAHPRPPRWGETSHAGLCRGLRELGYEERNVRMFYAFEEDLPGRLAYFATELARAKVDVILAMGTRAALGAKKATRTIPIVFMEVPDPVAAGLVGGLAYPGGNVTGVTNMLAGLGGKQLELLKEAVPTLQRVAVLSNPPNTALVFKETQAAARALGITPLSLHVSGPNDFEAAFSAITRRGADAVLVLPDDTFWTFKNWIVSLASQHQLPTMFWRRDFADAGALMTYGPNLADLGRRTAARVDKILKGANPADIPVEQPMKFDLTINLKTARALGLTIPPSLLFQADNVIK